MTKDKEAVPRDDVVRMLADAVLPPEIKPESEGDEASGCVLLTGACGYLGRRVARELLRHTDLRLICLVRDKAEETAAIRVARIFASMGIGQAEMAERVEVRVGDVTEPNLGLDADTYADLAQRVSALYHCAALVDWVRGYRQLYRMNVGGVQAMIRLACRGKAKRLVFVSSVAVCYALGGPERIDEDTDMLPFIGGMPLGYARSKCVAEALLRQASARGVPVTVLRPSLIAGDSASGESNPTDLIAALIQCCVATGMAMDTDWMLDCVPVDFVAEVMVRMPQGEANFQMLNLVHEQPRHWRELILWMNLHGYPIDLVESVAWSRHLFDERNGRGTMLYAQRHFFSGGPPQAREVLRPKPYEAYLAAGQRRIDASRTRTRLRQFGLQEARLDADLLHAHFEYYRRIGVLPQRDSAVATLSLDCILGGDWQTHGHDGSASRWIKAERTRIGSDDGLLSEIASARIISSVGLWRLCFRDDKSNEGQQPHSAVLKAKVSDRLMQDLIVRMAGVCRPELGTLFDRHQDALGLAGCHERELALYELDEPRLRRHMPVCYGTQRHAAGRWALLLEHLPEAGGAGNTFRIRAEDAGMGDILKGMAEIHSAWFLREEELADLPWLVARLDTARMQEMAPLWRALADFAAPWFRTWCGPEVETLQDAILDQLPQWWPRLLSLPATLIHNDFNPRNFVLRQDREYDRLCVYDWELATVGIPQHDLAELLCFTWQADMTLLDLDGLVEAHRQALALASGQEIEPDAWREGFALALRHLLINRLAMYTLMHRFRPLEYLPRVMDNWMRLHVFASGSLGREKPCSLLTCVAVSAPTQA